MTTHGRFPSKTLPHPYYGTRTFNLGTSTTKDLNLGDLIDLIGIDVVRNIELDYGYDGAGLPELRHEIAKRNGVPADWVVTTHGAAFALYLVAAELAQPGVTAVMPAPYFQLTYNTLNAHGWPVDVVQNEFNARYQLNLNRLTDELNPQVGLVSLASPQNPSGVSYPLETVQELVTIMARKSPNAVLLVDEIYREAVFDGQNLVGSASNLSPRVITCGSVSKAYGVPGLRAGWLIVADPELRQRFITAKQNIVISDSILTETLAAKVLSHAPQILEQQRQHMATGLQLVERWVESESELVDWVRPDAGALCCMRLNQNRFDADQVTAFWHHLAEVDTFVRPGLMFGSDNRHFRLGFGSLPFDQLEAGLSNLSQALRMI